LQPYNYNGLCLFVSHKKSSLAFIYISPAAQAPPNYRLLAARPKTGVLPQVLAAIRRSTDIGHTDHDQQSWALHCHLHTTGHGVLAGGVVCGCSCPPWPRWQSRGPLEQPVLRPPPAGHQKGIAWSADGPGLKFLCGAASCFPHHVAKRGAIAAPGASPLR
jgi:hypothetical protein